MDVDVVLTMLLWISMLFATLLILISAATVGRKLADLEFQQGAGVNGVRTIQSWINVRTHTNRVFLGVVFMIISILLLADAPLVWRTWVNRILFVLLLGSYAISSAIDWMAERRQLQILQSRARGSHDRAFAAGVKDAEDRAGPGDSVDVATIQAQPLADIAAAVRPEITKDVISAVTDAANANEGKQNERDLQSP